MSKKRAPSCDGRPFRIEWRPHRNTQRLKTVAEVIPCYYRHIDKKRVLFKGKKPDYLPANKILSQKEWQFYSNRQKRKNPILEGYKYLEYLESHSGITYKDVAEKFKVSKARVSQMIALVTRLPKEILDYLVNNESVNSYYFTERKLRPLTLMESDDDKLRKFDEMKEAM